MCHNIYVCSSVPAMQLLCHILIIRYFSECNIKYHTILLTTIPLIAYLATAVQMSRCRPARQSYSDKSIFSEVNDLVNSVFDLQ